ncbi:MAG: mechanosensitive ion channel family protein [Gammaproteobacteria bacterium]|nr:mechanosensitive ion channel family protein [Gammaproteobacteria bacterium]
MIDTLANLLEVATSDRWIVEVFLTVFGTLLLSWLARRGLARIELRIGDSHNLYDDALLYAARPPLIWLILLLGLCHAAEVADVRADAGVFELVDPVRTIGVVILVTLFALRGIRFVEEHLISGDYDGSGVDPTTATAVGKLLRISVLITAVLTAAQSLGFSIAGVLAFGGVGGIAIGFAARDLLANFFGGLMVFLDRPFTVGEWVRSPEKEIEGTVEHIGWRLTRIRTFDKRPIYVPNAAFTTLVVENPSRMLNRRIYETIGIRYADIDALPAILAEVRAMLEQHEDIDTGPTLMVNFNSFGASSLDFFIYTFTKTTVWTEFHRVKQDVLLRIAAIIRDHGAEVAFPTRTLHLEPPEPESSASSADDSGPADGDPA